MSVLLHPSTTTLFTRTSMPTLSPAPVRRPRANAVRPQAALGSTIVQIAKTAATSAAITAAFGGIVETLAPHGQRDPQRVAAAMKFGGGVGGGAALAVSVPHALAAMTGLPLGVVVGSSLVGAWLVTMVARRGR